MSSKENGIRAALARICPSSCGSKLRRPTSPAFDERRATASGLSCLLVAASRIRASKFSVRNGARGRFPTPCATLPSYLSGRICAGPLLPPNCLPPHSDEPRATRARVREEQIRERHQQKKETPLGSSGRIDEFESPLPPVPHLETSSDGSDSVRRVETPRRKRRTTFYASSRIDERRVMKPGILPDDRAGFVRQRAKCVVPADLGRLATESW